MNRILLYSMLMLLCFSAMSQDLKHCGADEFAYEFYQSNPQLQKLMEQKREELRLHTKKYVAENYARRSADSILTIPVVFHVIHNYGNENISEAQIASGIKVMNQGFRKQLADTANIVADFKPIAADCEIEFKLAKLDPNGKCTNGINRIASPLTNIGDHSVKNLIHWDPSKYLNIYVVKKIANLAGHCLMPDQAAAKPEWDGIVMSHEYVGDTGTANKLRSVVLAHEAGHYLNLFHIWGGNNVPGYFYLPVGDTANCSIGDDVQDTPFTKGWQNCTLNGTSCGNTVDNVQNAMDYSYCNFMFTEGQKQRMRAALRSSVANRSNLVSQQNLIATGVLNFDSLCVANFTASARIVCSGEDVAFTDKSLFNATGWDWDFGDGFNSTDANPTNTYFQAGDYNVVLTAKKNGVNVQSAPLKIRVQDDAGKPYFVEDFESVADFNASGLFNVTDNNNLLFSLNNQTGFNSAKSAAILMNDTAPAFSGRTILYSPLIDLTATGSPTLSFNYAFSQKQLNTDDVLELFISNDCGKTWLSRSRRTGATLRTVATAKTSSAYLPVDSTEWKKVSTPIPLSHVNSRFMFKVELTSFYGNNFFIDNININPQLYSSIAMVEIQDLLLVPNPANSVISISGDFEKVNCKIIDINGKLVKEIAHYNADNTIDVSSLSNGVYSVLLKEENSYGILRFVKY